MVLNEFLEDVEIVNKMLASTGFVELIAITANIAQNALSGAIPLWRAELDAQLIKIDEAIYSFETENTTLLIENSYLSSTEFGSVIYDYRNTLEEIFTDILNAGKKINALAENLGVLRANSLQITQGLHNVGVDVPSRELHEGQLVRFEFKQMSDFNSLRELGTVGRMLNVHIRSLMKLDPDCPMVDIEINTISKSSPFVVSAWLTKKAADAVNIIISGALENIKKVQEIRILEQSVVSAKIGNHSAEVELGLQRARADLELSVVSTISDRLLTEYPETGTNGTRAEVENGVRSAVEYLVTRTGKGLETKVLPLASEIRSSEPVQARAIIRQYVQQQLEHEQIMKQLPDVIDSDPSDPADAVEEIV